MADARLPIMRAGIIPGERPVTPEASTAYRSLITVRPRLPPPTRGPVQAPGARSLTPYSRFPPFAGCSQPCAPISKRPRASLRKRAESRMRLVPQRIPEAPSTTTLPPAEEPTPLSPKAKAKPPPPETPKTVMLDERRPRCSSRGASSSAAALFDDDNSENSMLPRPAFLGPEFSTNWDEFWLMSNQSLSVPATRTLSGGSTSSLPDFANNPGRLDLLNRMGP